MKLDLSKLCEFCIKSCVELRKVEELEQIAMERSASVQEQHLCISRVSASVWAHQQDGCIARRIITCDASPNVVHHYLRCITTCSASSPAEHHLFTNFSNLFCSGHTSAELWIDIES